MAGDLESAGVFAIRFAVTFDSFGCELIAAVAAGDEARDAPDGRDADAGQPVDFAIGQALLQPTPLPPSGRPWPGSRRACTGL